MSFTVNITFKGALFETTSKAERDQIGLESIKLFLGQIFLLKIHLQKRMRIFTKFYKVNWEVLRRSWEVWSGHHSEVSEFVKKIDKKLSVWWQKFRFLNIPEDQKWALISKYWKFRRHEKSWLTTLDHDRTLVAQSVTISLKSQKHKKFTSLNNLIEEPCWKDPEISSSFSPDRYCCISFSKKPSGALSPKVWNNWIAPIWLEN